jgi:hypothetical protein
MGTTEAIPKLKKELLKALKQAGLNKRQFAGRYFDETFPVENDDERKTFINTFNRQLSRTGKTAKILNALKAYLKFAYSLPEYEKSGLIPPHNVPYPEVDDETRRGMARISKKIDDALEEKSLMSEEADCDD